MEALKELLFSLGMVLCGIAFILILPRACTSERKLEEGIASQKTFIIDKVEYRCQVTNKLESGK